MRRLQHIRRDPRQIEGCEGHPLEHDAAAAERLRKRLSLPQTGSCFPRLEMRHQWPHKPVNMEEQPLAGLTGKRAQRVDFKCANTFELAAAQCLIDATAIIYLTQ